MFDTLFENKPSARCSTLSVTIKNYSPAPGETKASATDSLSRTRWPELSRVDFLRTRRKTHKWRRSFDNTTRRRVDRWAHHRYASLPARRQMVAHHLFKVSASEFPQQFMHYTKRGLIVHTVVVVEPAVRRMIQVVESYRHVLLDRVGGAGPRVEIHAVKHIPLPCGSVGKHELLEKEAE